MRIYAIPILKNRWAYYCHSTVSTTSKLTKAVNWSSKKWEQFGKADPTTWKRKLYNRGSHFMNQVDYQEWFLKSVPAKYELQEPLKNVLVNYPKVLEGSDVQRDLESLLKDRVNYHKKYMYYSAYWVPLSCTFVIVPLIPNIPLAYNLFRLYSHYKAYHGADSLSSLVNQGQLTYQQDEQLNALLNQHSFVSSDDLEFSQEIRQGFLEKKPNLKLLEHDLEGVLNNSDIKLIGETLDTPGLELELNRARSQILKAVALERFVKAKQE
ncbi:hypothetical protein G6F37_002568 [Rhizopus arrhizus]|nr:hypothetical protein G6F38_003458 [Rhizopus arrhizus]KAG1161982.1 hypothetical protein G6F37_002568 [Rhizopus arrhizus]